ncbi:MAG TPA: septum formation initiator family protein [Streptosporangiaceae bacterium]|nr:septum formation initiator family protein [Streptosporangiaceae bacterium]
MTEPASRAEQTRPGRPHFTGRAAILAVVLCAIALSLAYPVREYIAERRQLDQLQVQGQHLSAQLKRLQSQQRQLTSPAYIERQARDNLHMCLPTQMCYVIIGPKAAGKVVARRTAMPWYSRLWSSVQQADQQPDRAPKRRS